MKKRFADSKSRPNWTWEERENIVGFFALLLKVDKRMNPQNYKKKKSSEINRKYTC
jgi:hypothetical protein